MLRSTCCRNHASSVVAKNIGKHKVLRLKSCLRKVACDAENLKKGRENQVKRRQRFPMAADPDFGRILDQFSGQILKNLEVWRSPKPSWGVVGRAGASKSVTGSAWGEAGRGRRQVRKQSWVGDGKARANLPNAPAGIYIYIYTYIY